MICLYLLAAIGYGSAFVCLVIVALSVASIFSPRIGLASTSGEQIPDMIRGYLVGAFLIIAVTHWLTGV